MVGWLHQVAVQVDHPRRFEQTRSTEDEPAGVLVLGVSRRLRSTGRDEDATRHGHSGRAASPDSLLTLMLSC